MNRTIYKDPTGTYSDEDFTHAIEAIKMLAKWQQRAEQLERERRTLIRSLKVELIIKVRRRYKELKKELNLLEQIAKERNFKL